MKHAVRIAPKLHSSNAERPDLRSNAQLSDLK